MSPTPMSIIDFAGWKMALKLEGFTSSNSHKARAAERTVARLRRAGLVKGPAAQRIVFVISSSGNAGYEIAKRTVGTNVQVVIFTDVLSPREMVERLQEWPHVRVIIIDEPDASGSHAHARKRELKAFRGIHPDSIEIDQYADSDWPCGYFSLFDEIEKQVPDVGCIFVPVGTVATLRAAAQFKTYFKRRWKIYAVDATGSALNGTPTGKRLFSGFGNGGRTEWARQALPYVEEWLRVPDEAVVWAAHWLRARGQFLGASSGAAFAAAASVIARDELPHDGTPILICPDHGSHYRSTLYSDDFLLRHGFGHLVAPAAA